MKNMKTISLVDRLELEWPAEFQGNICQQAIALGDADNDGQDELVVGNMRGCLLVYKEGAEQKPWRYGCDLGLISCVAVGDICNKNVNYAVSLSAEGWCHLFLFNRAALEHAHHTSKQLRVEAVHRQHLPSNSKVMLLADIDDDGSLEMVVGYSDRAVQSFRWLETAGNASGEFVALEKWQLTGQIGSISLHHCTDDTTELLVSQPGGTYVSLSKDESGPTYRCHLMASSARARNASVFTELAGNIKRPADASGSSCLAMSTLDGAIILLDDNKMIFDFQVDHQLFGLTKLDISGTGAEAVVVCSWDGQTYIVSEGGQVTRFQFDEPVCAFAAGKFCLKAGAPNTPCLVYVTLDGSRLYVYHNIQGRAIMQPRRLMEAMHGCDEVEAVCRAAGVHGPTHEQLRSLYEWCLYGWCGADDAAAGT